MHALRLRMQKQPTVALLIAINRLPVNTINISAVIITLNEAKNIRQCLESVGFCADIVVVDSGSEDDTCRLAQDLGARVIHQPWLGYGPQKSFAVEQAKYDWVLCIDADEVVSPELQDSIAHLSWSDDQVAGYMLPRRNHFLGRPLHYGEGYPDLSLRLFNRQHGQWSQDRVHEGVELNGETRRLSGDLLHFSQETLSQYLTKQNHYTNLQAEALFARGKRCHASRCFTAPLIRFIKFYIIRRGFLDGAPGFIHIVIGCINTFSKYAKLLELQRNDPATPPKLTN